MKYIKQFSLTVMSLVTLLIAGSCMDSDINRNPFETTQEEMGRDNYNVGSKLKTLEGQVIPTQEHLYQFMEAMCGGAYGGYFSDTHTGWIEKFSTYNPKSDWLEGAFSTIFTNTYPNYRNLMKLSDVPVPQAIAKVLRVAIMQRTTDMFGPIPYSKIVVEGEAAALSSPYDSQDVIYKQMFKELDEADQAFEDNLTLAPDALKKLDDVYYGDVEKWRKYLHSLQLRMAMRLCYVPEMKEEVQRIAEAAVTAGVITDNADNALFPAAESDWRRHPMLYERLSGFPPRKVLHHGQRQRQDRRHRRQQGGLLRHPHRHTADRRDRRPTEERLLQPPHDRHRPLHLDDCRRSGIPPCRRCVAGMGNGWKSQRPLRARHRPLLCPTRSIGS